MFCCIVCSGVMTDDQSCACLTARNRYHHHHLNTHTRTVNLGHKTVTANGKGKTEGQWQMLMMGSIDQEIGALNRENNAVTHVRSPPPGYSTGRAAASRSNLESPPS